MLTRPSRTTILNHGPRQIQPGRFSRRGAGDRCRTWPVAVTVGSISERLHRRPVPSITASPPAMCCSANSGCGRCWNFSRGSGQPSMPATACGRALHTPAWVASIWTRRACCCSIIATTSFMANGRNSSGRAAALTQECRPGLRDIARLVFGRDGRRGASPRAVPAERGAACCRAPASFAPRTATAARRRLDPYHLSRGRRRLSIPQGVIVTRQEYTSTRPQADARSAFCRGRTVPA